MQTDEIKNLEDALAVIQTLKNEVEQLKQQNANLTELIIKNRKAMFGKKSEQIENIDGSNQLSFFNEAEQEYNAGAAEPTEKTLVESHERRKKRTREEISEGLEHKEKIYDIKDKKCPDCGGELVEIGKEFVKHELCIIPGQVFIVDVYRKVYKCPECSDDELTVIHKGEVPTPVMKKSLAAPETVAYVMQQKYQLGLPLHRQEQYWKAEGVELSRNTLANWIIRSSLWFVPLWNRMKEHLLNEDIIHADETPLRVLKRNGTPTNSQSRMWVFCSGKHSRHKTALYFHHATRSAKVVTELLGDYGGYLQTDGYSAYNAALKAIHVGCWSHARRKWVECLPKGIDNKNSKAARALELIEQIFAVDKGFEGMPTDSIFEKRKEIITPILEKYWDLMENINAPQGSSLQKAVTYSINQKEFLSNVMLDGRLEWTNNLAERAVKPFVMGRKNWLFSDTDKGADASARCFSIIETAKLNNLNVFGYLSHLLTELPKLGENPSADNLERLMPWSDELPDYCR